MMMAGSYGMSMLMDHHDARDAVPDAGTGASLEGTFKQLRHDLLTPVNQIIGYCEMLIEDAEESGLTPLLGNLRRILDGGRRAFDVIQRSLHDAEDTTPEALRGLRVHLFEAARAIIDTCDLMSRHGEDECGAGFPEDLAKIRNAAGNLSGLVDRTSALEARVAG
jgi:hypothetical protein